MANRENPCAGYLVLASDLKAVLPLEVQPKLQEAIDEADWEETSKLLDEHWPGTFPKFNSVFLLGDEDTGDCEMERGEIYVQFDTEDLYIQTPTIGLENLRAAGVRDPGYHQWTIWG